MIKLYQKPFQLICEESGDCTDPKNHFHWTIF